MSGDNLIDPLSPLITDDIQLPLQPDFSSLVSDSLGNSADPTDGFDQVLADLISIVDGLEGGLIALGGADGGDLDDTFVDILALDSDAPGVDVANLSAAIPDVQTNADNLGNLLTAVALPAPPTGGGGAPPPPSSDCSQRTNQYGLSTTGSFPGITCNWTLTFQVLRVQDGPCTYSAPPAAQTGDSHLPTIDSFGLQSGDASVWGLAHHTARASDGTPFDVIDVKITPHVTGHFDGVGVLVMNGGSRVWHVCLSVDFIA